MKELLRFTLEVIVSSALLAVCVVFVDTRKANKRLDLIEYKDSLMLEKMKELVHEHNKIVKSHNAIIDHIISEGI